MTAAVLSIGTELTRGELINSNAAWLGERLTELGFDVVEHATVDDDPARIQAQLQRLSNGARVVLCTGGLGPTTDDLTAQAVADTMKLPLERHGPSLQRIRGFYAKRNREMPVSNEKQADVPQGARVLDNEVGTAPGFGVQLNGCAMFFMPGVPREMQHLYHERVLPEIAGLVERNSHQIHLRTFGLPESQLADMLAGLEEQHEGATIGYRAGYPEIEVKVLARADSEAQAVDRARVLADEIKSRLGDAFYAEGDTTFPAAVGSTLANANLTLSVAESCTGGLVGAMLTSVPGSSEYLLADAVVYSNAAKTGVLGVSEDLLRTYGAVSEECALDMVRGALRIAPADLAVAITGIAGPGGGTDDKPVGTVWVAAGSRSEEPVARLHELHGDRERIRRMAAYQALRMVQRLARGEAP